MYSLLRNTPGYFRYRMGNLVPKVCLEISPVRIPLIIASPTYLRYTWNEGSMGMNFIVLH